MASRMSVMGAKGVVAYGRVRDLEELRDSGLDVSKTVRPGSASEDSLFLGNVRALTDFRQVWAKATSITGTGAEAKPHAVQVSLDLDGTIINPGDLVFGDFTNGVVIIPRDKISDVLEMLPLLVEADDRVKADVLEGMTVQEAFKKHRGQ